MPQQLPTLTDGSYKLVIVKLEDNQGNHYANEGEVLTTFFMDGNPPTLNEEKLQVTYDFKVRFEVTDTGSGVRLLTLQIEEVPPETARCEAQSFTGKVFELLRSSERNPGTHLAEVNLFDLADAWFGDRFCLKVHAEDHAEDRPNVLDAVPATPLTIFPSQRASPPFSFERGKFVRITGEESAVIWWPLQRQGDPVFDRSVSLTLPVSSSKGTFVWGGTDEHGALYARTDGELRQHPESENAVIAVKGSYTIQEATPKSDGGFVLGPPQTLTLLEDKDPPSPESLQLTLSPDTHPLGERALTIQLKTEEKNPWVRLFVERCLATTREECNREEAPVTVLAELSDPFVLEKTGFVGFRDGEVTTSWTPSQKEESFIRVRAQVADVAGNAITKINVVGEETLFARLLPPKVQDFIDGVPIVGNELALFGEASGSAFIRYTIAVAPGETKEGPFQVLFASEEPVRLASKPLYLLNTRTLENGRWTVQLQIEPETVPRPSFSLSPTLHHRKWSNAQSLAYPAPGKGLQTMPSL